MLGKLGLPRRYRANGHEVRDAVKRQPCDITIQTDDPGAALDRARPARSKA